MLWGWIRQAVYPHQGAERPWLALALCIAGLVLAYGVLIGIPINSKIETSQIVQARDVGGGHVFSVRLGQGGAYIRGDGRRGPQRSGLRLFEGERALGPAHSLHAAISDDGAGRYSHWHKTIYFSSSDNSDPRTNGRTYSYSGQAQLPVWFMLLVLLCFSGAIWAAGITRKLTQAYLRWRSSFNAAIILDRTLAMFRRIVLIGWPLFPIGIAASLLVSPIVNIDSVVQVSFFLNDFVIPHFPPLYPLFVRSIAVLTEALFWIFGGPRPHGFIEPNITSAALKIILLIQHCMAIAASCYLASQFRLGVAGQRIVAAVLYLNPFVLICVHSILSESLTAVFLLAAVGVVVPILLYSKWSLGRVVAFFVIATLGILTRHVALAFTFLLPVGIVFLAIMAFISHRPLNLGLTLRRLSIALAGILCAHFAANAVAFIVMEARGVEARSVIGRAFVYRLAEGALASPPALPGGQLFMSREEHAGLIQRLKSAADNGDLRHTIGVVAKSGYSWVGAFNRVSEEVRLCESCCGATPSGRCLWAETDRRLNRVARHALLSFDTVLLRDAAIRTGVFMFPFFVAPPFYPDNTAWFSWRLLRSEWGLQGPVRERFDGPSLAENFRWHSGDEFRAIINLAGQLRGVMVIIAIATIILIVLFVASVVIPFISALVVTFLTYAAMISIVTVYVPRYGLFIDILALIIMVIMGVSAFEGARAKRYSDKNS